MYETNNHRDKRQLRAQGMPAAHATRLESIAADVATLKRSMRTATRARKASAVETCQYCGAPSRHNFEGTGVIDGPWCRAHAVEMTACLLAPQAADAKSGTPGSRRAWAAAIAKAAQMLDDARLRNDDDPGPQAA